MSRVLPVNANLEHLKKQAKHLLGELLLKDPTAQLADAQHTIAREYGFASWPKLKAHVEALANEPVNNPFVGVWVANVPKSKRHPLNLFQAATIQFDLNGETLTITDELVNESGHRERSTNTIHVDGKERPSNAGYVGVATWRGPRVLETIAKKDGQEAGRGTYAVSADGQTLTITTADQVIILDKAE